VSNIAFDFFLITAYKSVSNVDWNAMTFSNSSSMVLHIVSFIVVILLVEVFHYFEKKNILLMNCILQ
jgi:hypothetical protein